MVSGRGRSVPRQSERTSSQRACVLVITIRCLPTAHPANLAPFTYTTSLPRTVPLLQQAQLPYLCRVLTCALLPTRLTTFALLSLVPPLPLIRQSHRLRAIQACTSSPTPKIPSARSPIIGLRLLLHTKQPQLPVQPSLHAHSLTTRQSSSARQQSHFPPGAFSRPHIRPSQPPPSQHHLVADPAASLPNTACSQHSDGCITPLRRLRARLQPSSNPSRLLFAVRRANRPPFRVRLRPATCTR